MVPTFSGSHGNRKWVIPMCLASAAWLVSRLPATAEIHEIASDALAARIADDGRLISVIGADGEDSLLAPPVRLRIVERKADRSIDDAQVLPRRAHPTNTQLVIEKELEGAQLSWTHEFEATCALSWKITFKNHADVLRAVDAEFAFSLKGSDYEPFFPGENDFPEWPDRGALHYCYQFVYEGPVWTRRNPLSLPLACVYSKSRDVGFSVVADFAAPILPATFEVSRSAEGVRVLVTRPRLRLDPGGSRTILMHLAPHAGDWRSCLAWVRDRWSECFTVPDGLEKFQNASYGLGGLGYHYPDQFLNDRFYESRVLSWPWRNGAREMTGLDRWRGLYVTEVEPRQHTVAHKWTHMTRHGDVYPEGFLDGMPEADAPYQEIVEFVESRKPAPALRKKLQGIHKRSDPGEYPASHSFICDWATVTTAKVREMIATMHRHNVYGFYYVSPRDVWHPYARDVFPDSIVWGPTLEGGYDWTVCDPYAGGAYRASCIKQVERLFELYPEVDGIFLDQCYGSFLNASQDDGISLDGEGRPLSAFSWDLASLLRDIAKIAHGKGKFLWQNHCHERIDLTRYCDLALVEGRLALGMGQETSRYATIGNRCCVSLDCHEPQLQVALRNGWYGGQLYVPRDDRSARADTREIGNIAWTGRLYYPLFELLSGRRWVLEPHCITAPDGTEANLFERPDGNTLAVLVSFGETRTTPWQRLDVPLVVRVGDADDIKAVYLLNDDRLGPVKIPFSTEGDELTVVLPRHRGASAVLLAKTGRFVALACAPSVRRGVQEHITLSFDNFTDAPWSWKGSVWVGTCRAALFWEEIPAGKETSATFATPTKAAADDPFFSLRLAMESECVIPSPDGAPEHFATFELHAEGPIQAFIAPGRKLVTRSLSNSKQAGNSPFHHALPLHLYVGETASFEVGLVNNTDAAQEIALEFEGERISFKDTPATVRVDARSHKRILVEAEGAQAGRGSLAVRGACEAGEGKFALPVEIIGTSIGQDDLAHVKSVALLADVWGRVDGSKKKKVYLNDAEGGNLAGGHGAAMWTTNLRTLLSDDARKALATANAIRIENPGKDNIKIRNVVLDVELDDGRTVHLRSDREVRSTSGSWMHAEGRRIEAGEPLTWECPGP